jgi:hypothetical protein
MRNSKNNLYLIVSARTNVGYQSASHLLAMAYLKPISPHLGVSKKEHCFNAILKVAGVCGLTAAGMKAVGIAKYNFIKLQNT